MEDGIVRFVDTNDAEKRQQNHIDKEIENNQSNILDSKISGPFMSGDIVAEGNETSPRRKSIKQTKVIPETAPKTQPSDKSKIWNIEIYTETFANCELIRNKLWRCKDSSYLKTVRNKNYDIKMKFLEKKGFVIKFANRQRGQYFILCSKREMTSTNDIYLMDLANNAMILVPFLVNGIQLTCILLIGAYSQLLISNNIYFLNNFTLFPFILFVSIYTGCIIAQSFSRTTMRTVLSSVQMYKSIDISRMIKNVLIAALSLVYFLCIWPLYTIVGDFLGWIVCSVAESEYDYRNKCRSVKVKGEQPTQRLKVLAILSDFVLAGALYYAIVAITLSQSDFVSILLNFAGLNIVIDLDEMIMRTFPFLYDEWQLISEDDDDDGAILLAHEELFVKAEDEKIFYFKMMILIVVVIAMISTLFAALVDK